MRTAIQQQLDRTARFHLFDSYGDVLIVRVVAAGATGQINIISGFGLQGGFNTLPVSVLELHHLQINEIWG